MTIVRDRIVTVLTRVSTRWLPFADAVSDELPLSQLARLGLFQASVGMALSLLAGTLNRVLIVELHVSATLVSLLVAQPLLLAPFRGLLGFRSDHHHSALGWRRVPYIWYGTLLQFGGFAILPFGLILLNGDKDGSTVPGLVGSSLGFLLIGAGAYATQTAGLALATDLAPERQRPRVVALLYLTLLAGAVISSVAFGVLLHDFSNTRLVQVIQGAAVVTVVLNGFALWKQEARDRLRAAASETSVRFRDAWSSLTSRKGTRRLLVATGIGAAAFAMQDALLEPYGGEVLHLGVGATSLLTGLLASGALGAIAIAARRLEDGADPARLSAGGAIAGVAGLSAVIMAAPLGWQGLFYAGVLVIGFGDGLYAVGTLTMAMTIDAHDEHGIVLGAWGSVEASCTGLAILVGGVLRDVINRLNAAEAFGPALRAQPAGYMAVYHLEILLLFVALVALGPLAVPVRRGAATPRSFGLSQIPG